MQTYHTTQIGADTRVRWIIDETYEGRFAYDTEEETQAAVDETLAKLESGEWVALVALVEHRVHGKCWREADALHGIVIGSNARELDEFAREDGNLDLDRVEFLKRASAEASNAALAIKAELESAQAAREG
jgi:hypothetical protein